MSRSRARSASAGLDNRAFHEAIANMRQENLEAKAEAQRIKDQLNCLIMLVRRAWMGDEAATVHVSNIVGVAPPSLEQEGKDIKLSFKSKAVHHWAMLTIGLLNKHYRLLEERTMALTRAKLQQRQDFLDEQLLQHRQIISKTQRIQKVHSSQPDSKHAELIKSMERLGVQSTNSSSGANSGSPQTMLEFLYPGREFHVDKETKASQHISTNPMNTKYMKQGLFDPQGVVSEKPKPKRPYSAHQILKKADSLQRTRPKSAIVTSPATKSDRPMKYETTRPVSGKQRPVSAKQRPLSGKQNPALPSSENSQSQRPIQSKTKNISHHQKKELDLTLLDDDESLEILKQESINMPRSMADSVAEELRKIAMMEEDFRKTTKMLQQKLGIPGSGTV